MTEPPSKPVDPVALLAFANDRVGDGYLRDLVVERKGIVDALERAPGIRVVDESNVTLDDLFDLFDRHHEHIALFHYGGHAEADGLVVEDDRGGPQSVRSSGLAQRLGMLPALRLVVLNGCGTRAQVADLQQHCRAVVIATECAIRDDAARQFAHRVYGALANGLTIQEAFDAARSALEAAGPASDTVRTGATRMLRPTGRADADLWPWALYVHPDTPDAASWTLPAPVPATPSPTPTAAPGRSVVPWAVVAMAVVGLVALAVWFLTRPEPADPSVPAAATAPAEEIRVETGDITAEGESKVKGGVREGAGSTTVKTGAIKASGSAEVTLGETK